MRKGKAEWLHSSVQAIIRNPVYRGWAHLLSKGKQDGDIVNETAHQPIVDPLLWKAAQPKEGKPRRTSDGSLLSGVLRCACCGRKLTPSTSTRKGKVYGYYRCRPRMVSGPECDAPASVPAAEVEALVTRAFFDWMAYRPVGPAPPDLAPFEQAVALAKADEAKWKEAALAGTVAPEVVGPAYDAAKARREEAEKLLFEARQTDGLDEERLTLAERWGTLTVPERRRALQAFEVVAYVERGRQPADERVTIELRGSPVADGWEPDAEYTLPSDEELAERITAEFAAAGIVITNVAERIAAWKAKYADVKIVIKPIVLSEEDKATEEAIFGPLERALRKRARQQAKRQPKATVSQATSASTAPQRVAKCGKRDREGRARRIRHAAQVNATLPPGLSEMPNDGWLAYSTSSVTGSHSTGSWKLVPQSLGVTPNLFGLIPTS